MSSSFPATYRVHGWFALLPNLLAILLFVLATGSSLHATTYTYIVSSTSSENVPGTLTWAIAQSNLDVNSTIKIQDNLGTIFLPGGLPIITTGMTIDGGTGNTLDGQGVSRIFFVNTANATDAVNIKNITLANGFAKGGNGGSMAGGGLGAGGAIFVNTGAVTVSGVAFSGNTAIGGSGGNGSASNSFVASGGGGGLGGNGGDGYLGAGGGGGGYKGNGGTATRVSGSSIGAGGGGGLTGNGESPTGPAGGTGGGPNGGLGGSGGTQNGQAGGIGGGGGGGGQGTAGTGSGGNGGLYGGGGGATLPGGGTSGGGGGTGGDFGGGGGKSGTGNAGGGAGGFGGGGGGGSNIWGESVGGAGGGDGGFGAGGGGGPRSGGAGGAYGGNGGYYLNGTPPGGGAGGGGAALGGAIFVRSDHGASLQFINSTETSSTATGGIAGTSLQDSNLREATNGNAAGAAFFLSSGTTIFQSGSVADSIGGDGAVLSKTSANTLTLSGSNSYTGGTSLVDGVLALGHSGALGTTGTISFVSGTLKFGSSNTVDYSARISAAAGQQMKFDTNGQTVTFGSGLGGVGSALTKLGSGVLVLGGSNTYTGTTTVSAGTLRLAGSLTSSPVNLAVSGVTLDLNGTTQSVSSVTGAVGSVIALGGGQLSVGDSTTFTITGNIQDTGGASAATGGKLVKIGSGTLTLTGSNTYSGGTVIKAGTVNIAADSYLGASSGTLTLDGGTLHTTATMFDFARRVDLGAGGGTIELGSGGLTLLNAITGSGALTKTSGNILTLTGAQTYTGSTNVQGGLLKIEAGSLASSAVTIASGATLNFNNGGSLNASIAGGGAFTRSGTGTTIYTGVATHTGGTVIDGGTLQIGSGSLGGSLSGAITNNSALTLAGSGLSILSGAISGTGGITQMGSGLAILSGSNSYSGATRLASGTLQLANASSVSASGTIQFAGGILQSGTNAVDFSNRFDPTAGQQYRMDTNGQSVTWATALTSAGGSLEKLGSGTLTLSGSNTYSGGTTIKAGTLNFSSDANLGALGSTVTLDGGTLHNTSSIFDLARQITLGAGGGTIALGSGGMTLLNAVTGSGALTKTSGNILTLTGAQTYTGSTSVQGGTLKVEAGSLASPSVDVTSGANFLFNNGGSYAGNITGGGTFTRSGTGTTILAGVASHTGGTIITDGTLQIGNGTTGALISSGAVANGGALVFNSGGTSVLSGAISGTGGLTQAGSGLVILSGSNSYSGATRLSGGSLQLASASSIAASGTIQFVGGILQSGSAALDFSSHFDTAAGQQYRMDSNGQSVTWASPLTSTGGTLEKLGSGTLTLTGANTYDGGTKISGGTINFSSDANLGAPGSTVTLDSGTLHNTAEVISTRNLQLTGAGGTVELGAGDLTLGAASGSGALNKLGTATLTLTGSQTYTGPTSVSAGNLKIAGGSLASAVNLGAGSGLLFNNVSTATGNITGAGGLDVIGTGVTIYTGSASHTGGTALESGTFQVGDGTIDGTLSGNVAFANGAILVVNRVGAEATMSGDLSGAGSFVKSGTGSLVLSGNNGGLSGGITVDDGWLGVGSASALGFGGTLTINGGGIRASGAPRSIGNPLALNGSFDLGRATTFTATTVLGADITITATNPDIGVAVESTLGGRISGDHSLTFTAGNNASPISLSAFNSYTGGTILNGGMLGIKHEYALGNGSLTVNSGTLDFNNRTVTIAGLSGSGGVITSGSSGAFTFTSDQSFSSTYAGTLQNGSGTMTFGKQGRGTLTLSGSNSYTGGTVVSGGVLLLDNANALGRGSLTLNSGAIDLNGRSFTVTSLDGNAAGTVTSGTTGAFTFTSSQSAATTYLGVLQDGSGTMTLAKLGVGTLTLSGSNSYTGGTVVNGGVLRIMSTSALGTGSLAVNSGTLDLSSRSITVAGLSGSTAAVITSGSAGAFTFTSSQSAATIYAGALQNGSGTMAFAKKGSGTLTLSGSNSYSGGTVVSAGVLRITNASALGTGSLTVNSGTLDLSSRSITVAGLSGGTAAVITSGSAGAFTFTSSQSAATTYLGVLQDGSGTMALAKKGNGTLTLSGTNSFTGSTSVQGGTLKVEAGSLASSTVDVSAGAKLLFNNGGSFGGNITGSGTFNSSGVGTMNFTGTASHTGGTVVAGGTFQLGNSVVDGVLSGNVSIASGATFAVNRTGAATTLTNVFTGSGAFLKSGDGTVTLGGASSYAGGTTVQAGVLKATNSSSVGSGVVTVDGGVFIVETSTALANKVVVSGGSYQRIVTGSLAHAADATSDLGRVTGAQILGGVSGSAVTLTTSFSATSGALNDWTRLSDVYAFQGTGTNTFVLQLSVAHVSIDNYLGWLDTNTDQWVNAVNGNIGGTSFFAGDKAYNALTDFNLGTYGVDTANGTVWAVINHNSDFATVPEPGTWALLAVGGLCYLVRRGRGRAANMGQKLVAFVAGSDGRRAG